MHAGIFKPTQTKGTHPQCYVLKDSKTGSHYNEKLSENNSELCCVSTTNVTQLALRPLKREK